MHEKAITRIQAHIEGSIRNTQIEENWFVFESLSPHVLSLAKEVIKHKSACIDIADVFAIFYDLAYQPIRGLISSEKPINGSLTTIIGEKATHQLCTTIIQFIVSLPREYEVYLPAPKLKMLSSMEISDQFSIVVFSDENEIPGQPNYMGGLLTGMRKALEKDLTYFRFRVSGYCGTRLESKTMRKALIAFKITLQQLLAMKLIEISPDQPTGIGLLVGGGHFKLPRYNLYNADNSGETIQVEAASLSMEFCRIIDAIKLKESSQVIQRAIEQSELPLLFKNRLKFPTMLLVNRCQEANRIRSAIEWCFDSYSSESTMAFLQVCIGLEAILGEDLKNESLTKSLADRCAYLTASDIKSRKQIRQEFISLYGIRSSLVHGTQRTLDEKQAHYLHWGRDILEHCIFREIRNLNMGKS